MLPIQGNSIKNSCANLPDRIRFGRLIHEMIPLRHVYHSSQRDMERLGLMLNKRTKRDRKHFRTVVSFPLRALQPIGIAISHASNNSSLVGVLKGTCKRPALWRRPIPGVQTPPGYKGREQGLSSQFLLKAIRDIAPILVQNGLDIYLRFGKQRTGLRDNMPTCFFRVD